VLLEPSIGLAPISAVYETAESLSILRGHRIVLLTIVQLLYTLEVYESRQVKHLPIALDIML